MPRVTMGHSDDLSTPTRIVPETVRLRQGGHVAIPVHGSEQRYPRTGIHTSTFPFTAS